MNAMKNKIKSQRGASITFALLLFLVCAIISSVVIVAATTVSGRASKMAELDQRYYAVNSAAELLRDVLEEQTVVVTTGKTTVSTVDQDGKDVTSAGTTTTVLPLKITLKQGTTETDISSDTSLVTSVAKMLAGVEGVTSPTEPLSLTAAGVDQQTDAALGVTLRPKPDVSNRKLIIEVSNVNDSKGTYTLQLTFKADVTQNDNTRTTYGTPIPTKDGSGNVLEGKYTKTKMVEQTAVSTIIWKLIDMQTVGTTVTTSEGD